MGIKENLINFGIKKGWKIFQYEKKELFSYSNWCKIKYERDVWTLKPNKSGPLAVFKDEAFIKKFLSNEDTRVGTFKVIPIYYIPSIEKCLYCFDWLNYTHRTNFEMLPNGTDFAESIFVPRRSLKDPFYINPSICNLY